MGQSMQLDGWSWQVGRDANDLRYSDYRAGQR